MEYESVQCIFLSGLLIEYFFGPWFFRQELRIVLKITIAKYPDEFSNNPLPNFFSWWKKKMPSRQNVVKSQEPDDERDHYTHFCWHDTLDSWLFSVCGSPNHRSGKIVPWDKIQIDKARVVVSKKGENSDLLSVAMTNFPRVANFSKNINKYFWMELDQKSGKLPE